MPEFKIIDALDVYLTSRSYEDIDDDGKPMTVEAVTNYHEKERVDLELPTEVVAYYTVFPDPDVSELFAADVADRGILSPLRIYTDGTRGSTSGRPPSTCGCPETRHRDAAGACGAQLAAEGLLRLRPP